MSLLLETTLGDIVIDLDIENSPHLCKNILKLAKARYYTGNLIYNVQPGRFFQTGDPRGDGLGGACIDGLIDTIMTKSSDVRKSKKRFIRSTGKVLTKAELREKGRVVATEMGNVKNTAGSQFLITTESGVGKALDGITASTSTDASTATANDRGLENVTDEKEYLSIGIVSEDENDVISKINALYCDKTGRPYADVRILKANILHDPFDDPDEMDYIMKQRQVILLNESDLPEQYVDCARWISSSSPMHDKPNEEIVEQRISIKETLEEENEEVERKREVEMLKKEDKGNAVILEMLGDIASAEMKPPENVLFVCKLNSLTEDEDLQLIFSRFDQQCKAEIIRDPDTGDSLQYAFIEFETKEAASEAYFKMNNALIDDRRIKVDFSQSVAKEWNRYTQKKRGIVPRTDRSKDNFRQSRKMNLTFVGQKQKKYYGGYRQHHEVSGEKDDSNRSHNHERQRQRRPPSPVNDEPSAYSFTSMRSDDRKVYEKETSKDHNRHSSRSDKSHRHRSDRYRDDKDRSRNNNHRSDRHSRHHEHSTRRSDDDSEDERRHKLKKRKRHSRHHEHSTRRSDDDSEDERRHKLKKRKKRHKNSSHRRRSRSRDRDEGKRRRHRSRSSSRG